MHNPLSLIGDMTSMFSAPAYAPLGSSITGGADTMYALPTSGAFAPHATAPHVNAALAAARRKRTGFGAPGGSLLGRFPWYVWAGGALGALVLVSVVRGK